MIPFWRRWYINALKMYDVMGNIGNYAITLRKKELAAGPAPFLCTRAPKGNMSAEADGCPVRE